ncbi:MAG: hypothetical protein Q7S82_01650 [bacterium]|nr:hypothetical protein [bacterium]
MTIIIAAGIFWFFCGFSAYGILKNDLKCSYEKFEYAGGYDEHDEDFLAINFLFGAVGLVGTLWSIVSVKNSGIGFCLRMPRELTNDYRWRKQVSERRIFSI